MATADSLVLTAPRTFERRTTDVPDVADDEGLLAVEACGLCGTDHEQWSGLLHPGRPFVPGHEIIGTLTDVGPIAADRWGVEVGQRVAVEVFQSCGECDECRSGTYRRCRRHGLATMYGFVPDDTDPPLKGGYASHLHLGPDSLLLPVPDSLDPVLATVFNPLGAGIRWGVTVPRTAAGDVVAVLGPGIRGLCAAVAAKEAGASFVMVTGLGPGDDDRLALASRFGADLAVDVSSGDPVRALKEATGGLADVVVDVTAKAPAAFTQALSLARPGGRIVVAGTRGQAVDGFQPDLIVYKELEILGALGVDAEAYRAALDLLAADKWPFADLPRRVVDLDGAPDLVASMAGESDTPPPVHGVIVPNGAP